jgi:hypothetical protein
MIKTAPSDTLRPPLGASAIQPQAWHEVQPTSRPVENSPLEFHKAAPHQLAVITAVGSPFCGRAVRGCACLERRAVSRSTKGGYPKKVVGAAREVAPRFVVWFPLQRSVLLIMPSMRRVWLPPWGRDVAA